MRIYISVDDKSIQQENWFLFCNNRKIYISDNGEENLIHIAGRGEYEILLTNNLRKNFLWYILLWIWNLLIAPINILLLNTDSDWYQGITPTILWRCKCDFQEDTKINIQIVSSYVGDKSTAKYDINITSSQNYVMESSYHEMYNRDSFTWEMNKYLSKFFSYECWAFAMFYFIFLYGSINNWCFVVAMIGVSLVLLFGVVAIYTVHKSRILQKQLKS